MPYQRTLQQQIAKTLSPAHLNDPAIQELLNLVDESYKSSVEPTPVFADKHIDLRQLLANIKVFNGFNAESRGNTIRLIMDEALPKFVIGNEVRLHRLLSKVVSNAIKCTQNALINFGAQVKRMEDLDMIVSFSINYTHPGNYPGQHTGFQFDFNFKKAVDPVSQEWANMQAIKDLSGIHILLVDDMEYNIMIAEKLLTGWNAKVDIAENGVEALSKARQHQYDIVLMDLQMPVMDGYSATRQIRQFDKNIPIIALTATASPDIMNSNVWGLTDFLAKPFKPAALYDMVTKYTKKNV